MPEQPEQPEQTPAFQIELENVRFSYGTGDEVLHGVTMRIRAGEHVCILGGNGSGKSTTVQLMNALLTPTDGQMRVMGLDPRDPASALEIRRQVAMVFQHPEDQMVTSIAADDVAFGPENLGVEPAEIARRVDESLAAVGMLDQAQADPADLSGGQKQRIAIAGALAMQPRVLLLDEPCAMLDEAGHHDIQQIIDELNARGITIVHVTHFMEDALRAGRVIVMDHGRVALDGTPEQVFSERATIRRLKLELPFEMRLQDRLEGVADAAAPTRRADRQPAPATSKPADGVAVDSARIASAAATVPAIAFERVTYSYAAAASARKKPSRLPWKRRRSARGPLALDDVSFTVAPGTLAALVGQTGSGKSTCTELTCALKVPVSGHVRIAGIDTADLSRRRELRTQVGYISQLPERQLFAETVFDDVAFGPRNLGLSDDEVRGRVLDAISSVGLVANDALLGRSPFALSGGQQRAVALAGILAMRQPIIVLDEPMAGLDPSGRGYVREILRDLKRRGTTMLMVTHSMDDAAELADQVIALDHGRVVADGTPRDVFASELRAMEGQPAGTGAGMPAAGTTSGASTAAGAAITAGSTIAAGTSVATGATAATANAAPISATATSDAAPTSAAAASTAPAPGAAPSAQRPALPGLPPALACARDLARAGIPEPLAALPLTLDELAGAIESAHRTEEVLARGVAR